MASTAAVIRVLKNDRSEFASRLRKKYQARIDKAKAALKEAEESLQTDFRRKLRTLCNGFDLDMKDTEDYIRINHGEANWGEIRTNAEKHPRLKRFASEVTTLEAELENAILRLNTEADRIERSIQLHGVDPELLKAIESLALMV